MSDRWLPIARSSEVTAGRVIVRRIGVRQVGVTRHAGRAVVFSNVCPHAGAPLSGGVLRDGRLHCPRHGWGFDLPGGACRDNPLYRLRTFEAAERDGWVYVDDPGDPL